jgi:hypothetical protein
MNSDSNLIATNIGIIEKTTKTKITKKGVVVKTRS